MTPSKQVQEPTPSRPAETATAAAAPRAAQSAPQPAAVPAAAPVPAARGSSSFAPMPPGAFGSALSDAASSAFAGTLPLPASLAPALPVQYQLQTHEWFGQPYVVAVPMLPDGYGVFADGAHGFANSVRFWEPDAAECAADAGPDAAAAAAAAGDPRNQGEEVAAVDGEGGEGEEPIDSLKLVLKLVVFVYLLGNGSPHRILLLSLCASLIFLAQTGRLDFIPNMLTPPPQLMPPGAAPAVAPGVEPGAETAADAAAASESTRGEDAAQGGEVVPEEERRGSLATISETLVAFFTSLFPGVLPAENGVAAALVEQNANGL